MKIKSGDEVLTGGRWYRAAQISDTLIVLTPLAWHERLRRWIGERIRFSGFWTRVWDR